MFFVLPKGICLRKKEAGPLKGILKTFRLLQRLIVAIIAVILVLIMCIILLQTFTRYVIFHSLPWSEELSRYLFVLLIVMGMNVGISQNLMVRIDLIDGLFKEKGKKILQLFRDIVVFVVCCIFLYSTRPMIVIGQFQTSPALRIPMHYMYTMLFVGFLLSAFAALFHIVERHVLKERGE